MRSDREEVLFRIAAQVGDGRAVDWIEEERAHPDLVATLRRMRQLESLARGHGGYERAGGERAGSTNVPETVTGSTSGARGEHSMKHCQVGVRDGAVIVGPLQDLTGGDETDEVVACVREHAEGGTPCVILDLQHVRFINSIALGAIITCHVTLSRHRAVLLLCNVHERNRKLLAVTKLDSVLKHTGSVESSLALWSALRADPAG